MKYEYVGETTETLIVPRGLDGVLVPVYRDGVHVKVSLSDLPSKIARDYIRGCHPADLPKIIQHLCVVLRAIADSHNIKVKSTPKRKR